MKERVLLLAAACFLLTVCQIVASAQNAGSIAGTVIDQNGAVIPNAAVTVKGEGGQEFTVTSSDNGTYQIPSISNGFYTVTVSSPGFKTSITKNVKVDVGLPTTVDSTLTIGDVGEMVEVSGGGEVLQTQTATVGTTITGRQILESPIPSRDGLDLVSMLPGTATVGAPRRASINGLPKSSITIQIDGVEVQDNSLRTSDGFFTRVRPRVDAIEEVTVSTSNLGAESSGDGAVQIKFVTKRGTNDYKGSVFYQHRNEGLNANYWYDNRDGQRDANGKAVRSKIRLHQYGGSFGGPIPFLNFGDGGGPWFNSGKDKAFFFVNYEEYRLPQAVGVTRVILSPEAQAGNFQYITGAGTQTRNLYTIAAANGRLSTPDPTIGALLAQIRASTTTGVGTITPITDAPNRQNFNFAPPSTGFRKFLALRFDFNLTKNHKLEFITNQQRFAPPGTALKNPNGRFPGIPSYPQTSDRISYSTALRSNFGNRIINEARYAISTGSTIFDDGISVADFGFQGGYDLNINPAGVPITKATDTISLNKRGTPNYDFTDTVTWLAGSHNISFGGQYKVIRSEKKETARLVPSVSFALDSTDPAFNIFANSAASLPGATATQLTEARNLYAMLVGRVSAYFTNAYLTIDGTYKENAEQIRLAKQNTYGLFVQDGWRTRPNLTINYGLRWQPQTGFTVLTDNFARLSSFDDVYGVSGAGNIFKPGTLTGRVPTVVGMKIGEKAYKTDLNNFAPSVGVAWSPDFGEKGFLRKVFGASGRSVFRGGYSVAFVREGFSLLDGIIGDNPGGFLNLTRSLANGNLTVGTNLRDPNNPNLTAPPFPASPSYPLVLTTANSASAFNPDMKTGSVHSFSFGYQREIDKNTVVEFRYVGNRGVGLQRNYSVNEFNTIENGFAAEFRLAQDNLYANITNGFASSGFAYRGAGTGTSPLPIMLSYFTNFGSAANLAAASLVAANYTATNFNNSTLVAALSRNAPNLLAFNGANFENNATRRANAIANGRPINFFYVNPTIGVLGSFVVDNSTKTWYDSGVIEVRRRLSGGLRMQASYVWSKARTDAFGADSNLFAVFTQREGGLDLAKNVQAYDIRHQFKIDATYDLPFGRGRTFFSGANGFVNALVGGFSVLPTVRWQSGSPFRLGPVQVVGMTVKELQKEIGVYKNTIFTLPDGTQLQRVTYLPLDIVVNTRRAFDISVANTNTNGGYGAGGAPTGRFIAPVGFGNCHSRFIGECGFNNLILYGPGFFKFDVTVSKKFMVGERRSVELRATFLDALNRPNFRVGGWDANVFTAPVGAGFGELGNLSAYQDRGTTDDPGGRLIDIMLRITF